MERFLEVIRDDGEVGVEDALEVFSILGPVLAAAPEDPEALEAAKGVIQRMPPTGILVHVLDWWMTITTGDTAHGLAWHLDAEITGGLREAMAGLLKVDTAESAAVWVRASRELDARLSELDDHLDLLHYGKSRMPKEHVVWAEYLSTVEATTSALRSGRRATSPELDEKRYEHSLKAAQLSEGSRRWKEMFKRAREATEFLNHTVELQHQVEPWKSGGDSPKAELVPQAVAAALGPLTHLLLDAVLEPGAELDEGADGSVLGPITDNQIAERIEAAATDGAEHDQVLLAGIVDSWIERTGQTVPVLSNTLDRLDRLAVRLEQIRALGTDTTEIELQLIVHNLSAAERLVTAAFATREQDELRDKIQRQRDRLAGRIDEATIDEPRLRERLRAAESLADEGLLDEAQSEFGRLEGALALADRQRELDTAETLFAELERLEPADSVLFDLRNELARQRESQDRRLPEFRGRIEEILADTRLERRDEAEDLLGQIETILVRDSAEFSAEALTDFELRQSQIRSSLEEGAVLAAIEEADILLTDIGASRTHRWVAIDGEDELIDHIIDYCTAELDFEEDDILRLHTAVKTKPFVILAGLTGSGKSALARLYAESMDATTRNGRFRRIAVRPDWIDQSEVLGFVNPVSRRFEPGWLADVVRQCEQQRDRLFFVLLDEMNLAPVEQYLAEMLSAMEEARSGSSDVRLPLYSPAASPENAEEWPHSLVFPPNLVLLGTVNVDETTRPLSDRVIDRANVIQLSLAVSGHHHEPDPPSPLPWLVPFSEWRAICATAPSSLHHDYLLDIAQILKKAGIGMGIRTHVELERFVANAEGVLDSELALDWGIVQRIIPKIRGFKGEMTEELAQLKVEFESAGAVRSAAVIDGWLDPRISDDEFLDGTDARVALALD